MSSHPTPDQLIAEWWRLQDQFKSLERVWWDQQRQREELQRLEERLWRWEKSLQRRSDDRGFRSEHDARRDRRDERHRRDRDYHTQRRPQPPRNSLASNRPPQYPEAYAKPFVHPERRQQVAASSTSSSMAQFSIPVGKPEPVQIETPNHPTQSPEEEGDEMF